MDYQTFLKRFLSGVNEELPAGRTANYRKVRKTNGVLYTGLCLEMRGEKDFSPIIYMEPVYERYCRETDLARFVHEAVRVLMGPVRTDFSTEEIMDPEYVRSHVIYRLMNTKGNEELLAAVPHRDYLDLSVTYGILLSMSDEVFGLAQISDEIAERLALTEAELYLLAKRNTEVLLGTDIKFFRDFAAQSCDVAGWPEEGLRAAAQFLVLTNRYAFFGSSILLNGAVLKETAERLQSDYYLLPTSVHELMAVPVGVRSPGELKTLLEAVASDEKRPENLLTGSFYRFDRADNALSIAGT